MIRAACASAKAAASTLATPIRIRGSSSTGSGVGGSTIACSSIACSSGSDLHRLVLPQWTSFCAVSANPSSSNHSASTFRISSFAPHNLQTSRSSEALSPAADPLLTAETLSGQIQATSPASETLGRHQSKSCAVKPLPSALPLSPQTSNSSSPAALRSPASGQVFLQQAVQAGSCSGPDRCTAHPQRSSGVAVGSLSAGTSPHSRSCRTNSGTDHPSATFSLCFSPVVSVNHNRSAPADAPVPGMAAAAAAAAATAAAAAVTGPPAVPVLAPSLLCPRCSMPSQQFSTVMPLLGVGVGHSDVLCSRSSSEAPASCTCISTSLPAPDTWHGLSSLQSAASGAQSAVVTSNAGSSSSSSIGGAFASVSAAATATTAVSATAAVAPGAARPSAAKASGPGSALLMRDALHHQYQQHHHLHQHHTPAHQSDLGAGVRRRTVRAFATGAEAPGHVGLQHAEEEQEEGEKGSVQGAGSDGATAAQSSEGQQKRTGKDAFLTLPTILTLARVAMVPAILPAFYLAPTSATALFVLASFTDWLDGFLARKMNLSSSFGAFLDPVADKLMVAAVLVLLCTEAVPLALVPTWVVALPSIAIIGREIAMSAVREWAASLGPEFHGVVAVSALGKWKTATQMVSLTMLLAARVPMLQVSTVAVPALVGGGVVLLYASSGLAVWSLGQYMVAIWRVVTSRSS